MVAPALSDRDSGGDGRRSELGWPAKARVGSRRRHAPTPIDPGRSPSAPGAAAGSCTSGRPIDDERFLALITPGRPDRHGDHRRRLRRPARPTGCSAGRSPAGRASRCASSAPSGTTSTRASATGPRASRASPIRRCAAPTSYADYLRMATERSLERCGVDRFDLLLLHNPDRIGYTSERVWKAMAALREAGPDPADRRRARPRQRLHARPDRLPGALRRADRLGDDHPQPARAVAGRARASRPPRPPRSR